MMHQTEIKFVMNQVWGDFKVLWLMKYELDKAYNGFMKDGNLEWQEVEEGSTTEGLIPFMKIPYRFPIQELINALSEKLPSTPTVETLSELKATKYHLEDMRKLLFSTLLENKDPQIQGYSVPVKIEKEVLDDNK